MNIDQVSEILDASFNHEYVSHRYPFANNPNVMILVQGRAR
ncbi:hypothetical protein [Bacillus thuringiensis]|nr:hypothetical protein [Bacillus thuringiensis]